MAAVLGDRGRLSRSGNSSVKGGPDVKGAGGSFSGGTFNESVGSASEKRGGAHESVCGVLWWLFHAAGGVNRGSRLHGAGD